MQVRRSVASLHIYLILPSIPGLPSDRRPSDFSVKPSAHVVGLLANIQARRTETTSFSFVAFTFAGMHGHVGIALLFGAMEHVLITLHDVSQQGMCIHPTILSTPT
jgi:hypothetical protein